MSINTQLLQLQLFYCYSSLITTNEHLMQEQIIGS